MLGRQALIKIAVLVTGEEEYGKILAPLIGPEWRILTIASPEEALASVTKTVPHLILADMDLAGMNGITFLKLTKDRLEGTLPPSVLVVNSPLDETDQARTDALGLLDLLTAPLNSQLLERSLAPLISEAGPMRLSILEFLAMAFRESLTGVYRVILEAETIEIEVSGHRAAELVLDGQPIASLDDGDVVACTPSESTANFVRFGNERYHQILKAKFGLADR